MHLLLNRSLIFIGLLMAGLALYVLWFNMSAGRYDETAVPYLEKALPQLGSWKFSELAPMLSPQARSAFETDKGQQDYRLFSKLGEMKSVGKPQYISDNSETSEGLGAVEVVSYKVPVIFETGPALINIQLASNGEKYFIHRLEISSEIFVQSQE